MSRRLSASPDELREGFFSLRNRKDVALLLDVPYARFVYHLYKVPEFQRYIQFKIPKRRGGARLISVPASPLKLIQQKLNQVLQAVYSPKPSTYGFVQNRNVVKNADQYANKRFVLTLDLKNFFPSINFGRVRGLFISPPYNLPEEVATTLAQLCCHDNQLPQGAPTSPVVSNMVCRSLDTALQRLAEKYRCTYTRYADDITFSTTAKEFPKDLAVVIDKHSSRLVEIGPVLRAAIENCDFHINEEKVRLHDRRMHQEVTGLVVNRKPNVPRRFVRQVWAMLHAWQRYGLQAAQLEHHQKYNRKHRAPDRSPPDLRRVVRGKIEFIGLVRGTTDPLYENLLERYVKLDPTARRRTSRLEGALWVLESLAEGDIRQGTGFMLEGFGLVTCAHVLGSATEAFRPEKHEQRYPVQVLQRDEERDLAVLCICNEGDEVSVKALIRAPKAARRFAEVSVAGFPNYRRNDSIIIHTGKISGFRTWGHERRLLLDARIAGMSGGPVLNETGQVIGIAVQEPTAWKLPMRPKIMELYRSMHSNASDSHNNLPQPGFRGAVRTSQISD